MPFAQTMTAPAEVLPKKPAAVILPAEEGETMTVKAYPVNGGDPTEHTFPVIGHAVCGNRTVPLVDIPQMSDYKWQLEALNDRLENPEKYRKGLGEDVEAAIARLRKWLYEHKPAEDVANLQPVVNLGAGTELKPLPAAV